MGRISVLPTKSSEHWHPRQANAHAVPGRRSVGAYIASGTPQSCPTDSSPNVGQPLCQDSKPPNPFAGIATHRAIIPVSDDSRQLMLLLCSPLPLCMHSHLVHICHSQLVLLACMEGCGERVYGEGQDRSILPRAA